MPYIILDRDGVINFDSDNYIKSPDEWIPIPESPEAIALLNQAGFEILIATNQSGIGRGYYTLDILNAIHNKMHNTLTIAGATIKEIFFCPHLPDAGCECRKPKLGLLNAMKAKYQLDFASTYFIGDSHVDMKAATAAGCQPLLVLTGNGAKTLKNYPEFNTIPRFDNLMQAVKFILKA